ncbi:11231_t:CDS:1, partial [Funneliformis caledonium]
EKELQQHQIQFLDPNTNPIKMDFENSEIPAPNSNDDDCKNDIEDDANIITSEHWK